MKSWPNQRSRGVRLTVAVAAARVACADAAPAPRPGSLPPTGEAQRFTDRVVRGDLTPMEALRTCLQPDRRFSIEVLP